MTTVTVGSGLGAQAIAKSQGTWGGTFMGTGGTTLLWKTAKLTFDPHIVDGGPYLNSGQLASLASTRVLTWLDAKVTLTGDMTTAAAARQLICAMGTSATLSEIGTTTAYGIGGTAGGGIGDPNTNDTFTDLQIGIPTTDGVVNPFSFHSGYIQKAEWMFDRSQIVTFSYDYIFQYVETSTGLFAASVNGAPQVFSMATSGNGTAGSCIAIGPKGSEVVQDGVKKATLTMERQVASEADRMYLGSQYQQSPIVNNYIKVNWALDADYTPTAKTNLFDLLLSGATVPSIYVQAVGSAIGSSGYNNTLKFNSPSVFVNSGGEPSPDGPKVVGNTIMLPAYANSSNDPILSCTYLTSDSTAP